MNLTEQVNADIMSAMKEKNQNKLKSLRAIKSELLLAATEKGAKESTEDAEIKILQRLVKQRKDAAEIFIKQGREDLATEELNEISFIEVYLPEQLSVEEIAKTIANIIKNTGASSMKDMGKVMGLANKQMGGKADGKTIAEIVKKALNQ